jgi:hypothetical protein
LQGAQSYTPELAGRLTEVWKANKTDSPIIAKAHWTDLAPLLGDSSVVEPLADYIRHEGNVVWRGWSENRANCIGYAQLYDYLLGELTGGVP